jgi:hypothetical protein
LTSNASFFHQSKGDARSMAAVAGRQASEAKFTTADFLRPAIDAAAAVAETNSTVSFSSLGTANFADFDFANGTRYPEQATASVGPATYKPGATVAHVPITLDRPTPNTIIARVMTEDGTGLVRGGQLPAHL